MKAKLHLVFSITIFFSSFCTFSQQDYWKSISAKEEYKSASLQDVRKQGKVFGLSKETFKSKLPAASSSKTSGNVIHLPNSKGELIAFQIKETSVLHPELSKKYPGIKSYSGQSLDNQYRIKLSQSHKGFQGMMVSVEGNSTSFMEPVANASDVYVVYDKESSLTSKQDFVCETEKMQQLVQKTLSPLVDDQVLRKFRIAVSTTGEYTSFHGGTVADALAAINATLTRVNEVFETDLGVTLELIPNNDLVIFTNAATDPYNGNLNAQVQSTLTTTIGEANYDVGHLFNRVGQGQDNGNAGFIGAVCEDNRKGSAFASAFTPQGDVFDLDFVAHELGHQFGANHTWSFESEGTGVQAEPASGTTIMGYAGIVPGNNVQPNGDDYFHYNSIFQIRNYLATVSCGENTALTNNPPTVTPIGDFIIPQGTAFVLEGVASDSDVGDVLTYTWEQIDDGVVTTSTFGPESPVGANFRSLPPSISPQRYFPRLSRVIQGSLTQTNPPLNGAWETVSNIQRDLSFALTVRDNAVGGGQVVSDLLDVNVIGSAGPFTITSQSTNEIYEAGSVQTITWDVANTDIAPINAQTVDIFMSIDGGITFPITVLQGTLNDGTEDVQMPGNASTNARIMVKASDNVFFAVNSSNFTIQETDVVLNFQELSYEVCQPNDIIIPFTYQTFGGFSETSTFSANVPAGMTSAFAPIQADANDTAVNLTLSNTGSVTPGVYTITVTSTSATVTKNVELSLVVQDGTFGDVVLVSPADSESDVPVNAEFTWQANPAFTNYDIEIATDIGFSNIVESASIPFTSYTSSNLDSETSYFWRVRPSNGCGTGTFGTPFTFTTVTVDCKTLEANNLPISISPAGTSTISTSVSIFEDLSVSDVNIDLELNHTYLEDLVIHLISPAGTRVALISNTCGDLNNINAVFDDDGTDISCSGNPAISGTIRPIGALSSFVGESTLGEWTLEIQDTAPGDGGSLIGFTLEVCVEGTFRPDEDEDGVFDDGDDLCLGTPKGVEVDTSGCPVNRLPADNFLVEIQSESCRNNNDGSVAISTTNTALTYTATLDGSGTTLNADFTTSQTFENLTAGNYSLCINGTDGTINYQEVCFDIVVSEPDILSVSAVQQDGVVSLNLEGGSLYNVELNGLVQQTENSELEIELKEGLNTLKVFTNLPCQGSFEGTFRVSFSGILYPNPIGASTKVFISREIGDVFIQVFSAEGRLVMTDSRRVDGSELEMDFSALPTGVYYLRLQGAQLNKEFKMIKR
ncbi:reprolysin-like metallopeptidase [Flagellimonas allohymeniacidonis]|uniref:T9SS type A sorting domain-containing protein n=1 Tax=Flagellimonas allohymeniacidonis TaxID=2517819 RepID=A0A4Q8QFV6_9FLAO|nr:zinc-dependent metalloprotease family protein [Allomuricauda hymeniacidonis]TAI47219.1 T9SS type A sorting domain-containing protein [Allomuricauda hymeniacidonis]